MKTHTATLAITVTFTTNGEDPAELETALEYIAEYAAGEGLLTPDDTEAEVETWEGRAYAGNLPHQRDGLLKALKDILAMDETHGEGLWIRGGNNRDLNELESRLERARKAIAQCEPMTT